MHYQTQEIAMGTLEQEYIAICEDHAECHRLLNSAGELPGSGRVSGRLRDFIARQSRLLDAVGERLYVIEAEQEQRSDKNG
jgi:hypothetical protein